LQKQTYLNFQWLVIDDGSTDSTKYFFEEIFKKKLNFKVDYFYKPNGGKHSALNYSHNFIKGKYLVIVDSDDTLIPNAVELIISKWKKFQKNPQIGGITFQRGYSVKEKLDHRIQKKYISSFSNELNNGMTGDHCETVRTDLFKKFEFPIFKNEKFVAEGAMWFLITKNYKVVYYDEVIYICKYLENGLTKTGKILFIRNPNGSLWHALVMMNKSFTIKLRLKNALLAACYAIFSKKKLGKLLRTNNVFLLILTWWPGLLIYIYWKLKYVKQ
jgi:glycosyltransferase involved in cell wall biosynthesis